MWWNLFRRLKEEADAEAALRKPEVPYAYRPGVYGNPGANPTVWAPTYAPPLANAYNGGQAPFGGPAGVFGGGYRPLPYQKPPKLKDKNFRRHWVQVPPPPPGTRVFLTDAPIYGTNYHERIHIDHSSPPQNIIPVTNEDGEPLGVQCTFDSSSEHSVYMTPRSENQSPTPGDPEYVPLEDLTFPPTEPSKIKKMQAKRRRHGPSMPDRDSDPIAIPLSPRIIPRRPRTSGSASYLSEFTSSHLSLVTCAYDDAEVDTDSPETSPTGDRPHNIPAADGPASSGSVLSAPVKPDNTPLADLERMVGSDGHEDHQSMDGGDGRVLIEDSSYGHAKRQAFKNLFRSNSPKPTEEQRKPSLQVAPGTTILHTRQRLGQDNTPLTEENSPLSRAVASSQATGALPTVPAPVLRRDVRFEGSADSHHPHRLFAYDVPLPRAVEALRPRSRREHTDSGGQQALAVSDSRQPAVNSGGGQRPDSPQSDVNEIVDNGQPAIIEQPWATIIPLPQGAKVEEFNAIRELTAMHAGTADQPSIRVIALPKHVRLPGTPKNKERGWRKNSVPPGTAQGPPLRVVQLPEELNVEYFEQRAIYRHPIRRLFLFFTIGAIMVPLPLIIFSLLVDREDPDSW